MDDLISRQAVIDALEKVSELYPWRVPGDRDSYSSYNEAWQDALNRAENEIEALPSAQPEQKSARWTKAYDGNDGHVKCTCCFKTYDWISQAQYYNFCPNCGADMRGDKDDIPMEYFENGGI